MTLRAMAESDAGNLLKIFEDAEAMKYYSSTKSEQDTRRWIQWMKQHYQTYGISMWIAEDKQKGEFLGQCGMVLQKVDGKVDPELGYLFLRSRWGKGYASEAAKACLEYGLHTLKFQKIISLIDPDNFPSIKLAERIGMKKEKQVNKWDKSLFFYSIYNEK